MDVSVAFSALIEANKNASEEIQLQAATTYLAYVAAHAGLTYVQLENLTESVMGAFTDLRGREDTVEVEIEELEIDR